MKPARMRSLGMLSRLRKRETDAARMVLSRRLAEERRIEGAMADLKARMQENRLLVSAAREEAARGLTLWSGYRHWLPVAQEELEKLDQALAAAREQSRQAREVVMEQVRQQEVTAGLLRRERVEQAGKQARQEQAALDERASRNPPPGEPGTGL